MTGHQGTRVPPDQDDRLVREVVVNLREKKDSDGGTDNGTLPMGPAAPAGEGGIDSSCSCCSYLCHFAPHCANHVLETLQHSHPAAVVQQVGGDGNHLSFGTKNE